MPQPRHQCSCEVCLEADEPAIDGVTVIFAIVVLIAFPGRVLLGVIASAWA